MPQCCDTVGGAKFLLELLKERRRIYVLFIHFEKNVVVFLFRLSEGYVCVHTVTLTRVGV